MSAIPFPAELDRDIERLLAALSQVRKEYRWVYNASLQPSVVETAGGAGAGQADPTGGVVSSEAKAKMRAKLRDTAKTIRESTNLISSKHRDLQALMGQRGIPTIPRGGGPRTATRVELEEARANQKKREAAGGGFGES